MDGLRREALRIEDDARAADFPDLVHARQVRRALLAALLLACSVSALAQKTDIIELSNGDRVTGEIKYYSSGRLTVDTSHSSWIKVKWSLISSISSDKQFDIETIDGVHHYGSLAPSDPLGRLTIVSGPQTITIDFFDVFNVTPIYQTFWKRWEGSLDLGFNYTQSSHLTQFNFDFDGTYRMRESQFVVDLTAFFSRQENVTAASRGAFEVRYDRFLGTRWVLEGGIGLDRNTQLGLDLRETVGVGGGRFLFRSNQAWLVAFLGVTANHEIPVEGDDTEQRRGADRRPLLLLHVRLPEAYARRRPHRLSEPDRSQAASDSRREPRSSGRSSATSTSRSRSSTAMTAATRRRSPPRTTGGRRSRSAGSSSGAASPRPARAACPSADPSSRRPGGGSP